MGKDRDAARKQLIGLGAKSISKSYYPELRKRLEELEVINRRLTSIVNSARLFAGHERLADAAAPLLGEFAKNMEASGGALFLVEGDVLSCAATLDADHVPVSLPLPLPGTDPIGEALRTKRPVLDEHRALADIAGGGRSGWRSGGTLLVLPLIDTLENVLGVVTLYKETGPPFSRVDVEIGHVFASYICEALRSVKALERLSRSEERYRDLYENAPVGFFLTTPDGRYESANPELAKLYGYDSPEELMRSVNDIKTQLYANPEDRERALEIVARDGECLDFESLRRHKDGYLFWTSMNIRAKYDENGEIVLLQGFTKDIDIQKQHEEALVEAKDKAEEANAAKSEFLANMSHEIRTPLNGILGMLQLLQLSEMNEEQAEYADNALLAGKRLASLLSDLLDLSVVESGRVNLNEGPLDIRELTDSVQNLFAITAQQKGVELSINVDVDDRKELVGDDLRLRQVLFNLVGNAIKFTEQGVVRLEVLFLDNHRQGQERMLVVVEDSGPGIPEDKYQLVFEMFGQADQGFRRSYQGAGLGLPIVKRLVALMNGTLCLESREGEGTTFYVSIPLNVRAAVSGLASKPAAEEQASVVGSVGEGRADVLLVEDEKVNAIALSRLIQKMGDIEVVTVENGETAIQALRERQFDFVFMDIQMPVMDGVEATRLIRAGEAGPANKDIPIIAMTAYAMQEDRERFIGAGMDDYIPKPVDYRELAETLAKYMPQG